MYIKKVKEIFELFLGKLLGRLLKRKILLTFTQQTIIFSKVMNNDGIFIFADRIFKMCTQKINVE